MGRVAAFSIVVCCLVGTALGAPQPPDIVAVVGDRNVTKEELAAELAKITGREVLDNLIQERLIRQEIARRRIVVPPDAVDGRMKAIDFKSRKQRTGDLFAHRPGDVGSTAAQRRGVELLIAIELMAKEDFGIHLSQPVTNLQVAKWLRAIRNRAKIVGEQGGKLPKGVYASVNGEYISKDQFNKVLFLNSNSTSIHFALDRIIERTVIEQKVKGAGLALTESDIDSTLARMEKVMRRDPRNTRMTLESALGTQGVSPQELRIDPNFRMLVAARKFMRREISTAQAEHFCEQHKALYGNGEVRASQILVSIIDPQTMRPKGANAQREALRKITEVYTKLKAGADFAELAKQYSDDTKTKDKGGDLGFFARYGVIRDPMAGAAFLLRPGEFSGVLASPYGFHIMKTTDVKAPEFVDFAKVRERVINDIIDLGIADWTQRLRRESSVKILYK